MRKTLTILMAVFNPGCGTEAIATKKMPDEVAPYYYKFLQDAANHNTVVNRYAIESLTISFLDKVVMENTRYLGVCYKNTPNTTSVLAVYLDKDFWDVAPPAQREALVYHELGHCLLGEDHRDESAADGTFASVMHAALISGAMYYKSPERHEAYLVELFSHAVY